MPGLVTLPDGQAVRPEDVSAVKIEEFTPGNWYVYVEMKNHPRVSIKSAGEDDALKIAAEITKRINYN
jgi:hypothetical protein